MEELKSEGRQEFEEEFIFRIFKLLVLGGRYNQYEDKIDEYRETSKAIYKSLASIVKDDSGQVFIDTLFYEVEKIDVS